MQYWLKIIAAGVLIGIVLFSINITLKFLSPTPIVFDEMLLKNLGLYILYSVPLSVVNSWFFEWMNHRINWEKYKKYRLSAGIVGSVIITLITIFLVRIIHRVGIDGLDFSSFIVQEQLQFYFIALLITLVISLFFHAIHFYKALQEKKVKEQKIIAGTASAQFESLKNQIDPHFLFNSLNVLTSLIEENPELAQKFTTSLSKIYRYVLEQKDKELVSLEEELAFAKIYMQLLQVRFENSLHFEMPEALSNPDAKVVPLSLQLLLENTIKHNVVSEKKPLRIRIYEEGKNLVIENNLQKKEVIQTRKGVGLENIVNRYAIITNRKVTITEDQQVFKVKIPVLTKQITVMETNHYKEENNAYLKAHRRVKEIKEFYSNLISYCIVIPFLIGINYYTYWDFHWFWFPLFGWGLGLAIHGFTVFGYGASWEENKIKEIMEKEQNKNKTWN
tara:strand:- start:5233 stop:6573 length:1341 start_codon:yes stop_codon:yes gene_type:complete